MRIKIGLNKIKSFLGNSATSEQLYVWALALYTSSCVISTTTFQNTYMLCMVLGIASLILLAIKTLFFDAFSIRQFCIFCGLLINLCLMFYFTRNTTIIGRVLIVACAFGVCYKKILKTHLIVHFSVVLLAVFSAYLGVIKNYTYNFVNQERGIRESLGICYPTDLAAHVFYIIITYLYLFNEKLRWYSYIFLTSVVWFVYKYTNARVDCISMLVAIFGVMILNNKGKKIYCNSRYKYRKMSLFQAFGIVSMPLCAIGMYILTYTLSDVTVNNEKIAKMFNTLLVRFFLGKKMLDDKGISLFGINIKWIGGGDGIGSSAYGKYNFVDCSYIKNLFDYGLVFSVIIIASVVIMVYKNYHDDYLVLMIILISINCVIAHHLLETSYNPFILLVFSNINEGKDCFKNMQNKCKCT